MFNMADVSCNESTEYMASNYRPPKVGFDSFYTVLGSIWNESSEDDT